MSRPGRIRKKSTKFADYLDSTDEILPMPRKKSPTKSSIAMPPEADSSTSDSTSSSSDDSDDSADPGFDDGAIDLKDEFLEYGNWEDDIGNTLANKDESDENTLQVDENAGRSRRKGNASQVYSKKNKATAKSTPGQKHSKGKKGRAVTAYMLWAKENRSEIANAFPDLDFSHVNKRLGEAWGRMPRSQKFVWKRRAKDLVDKVEKGQGGTMITTGKGRGSGPAGKSKGNAKGKNSVGRPPKPIESKAISLTKPFDGISPAKQVSHTPKQVKTPANVSDVSSTSLFKVSGTSPIDVAAHLKLLGESLNNIGQKLKEHEGQIAVSGSLSVLLDSMLCVLGPLACLTNQLEETRSAIPEETLNNILDNIAYIMPGIV